MRVCTNKECKRAGARRIMNMAEQLAGEMEDVEVQEQDCFDFCGMGPNVQVNGKVISGVKTPEKLAEAFANIPDVDAEALKQWLGAQK